MQKLVTLAILGLVAAAVAAPSTVGAPQQTQKVWLCHKTSATFTTTAGTFVRFAPLLVSTRASVRAHVKHGDVAVSPAPTGSLAAQRQAARTTCAALRVPAPITPTRGGKLLDVTLTGSGITVELDVRTQVGQRRLCVALDVTVPAGATIQLTSLTLTQGATTITIPSAQLTGTDPSGCVTLSTKALAKQILDGGFTVTLNGTVTPSGGSATPFQLTGTLSA
jgi:hypothetical protein